jgi:hypothetical protein
MGVRVPVFVRVRVRVPWVSPGRANGLFSSGATALSEALANVPALACIKLEYAPPVRVLTSLTAEFRPKDHFNYLKI